VKPNPLAPFPCREGGKLKASLLQEERNGSEVFGDTVKSQDKILPLSACGEGAGG